MAGILGLTGPSQRGGWLASFPRRFWHAVCFTFPTMNTRRGQRRTNNPRRGFQALELLFAVPILVAVLAAALQCGKAMVIRSGVVQAATVAAREAGKGAGLREVVQAVNCVLAVHGIAVSDRPGSGTKLAVQVGQGNVQEYGDPRIAAPRAAIGADETLATVRINFEAGRTDGRKLLGDSFGVLGLAFGDKGLSASALARQERAMQAATAGREASGGRDGKRGVSNTHWN